MNAYLLPILLLTISNTFMTFAWYGHLKFEKTALWIVILASWGIAFFEYCFQVPANRIGNEAGLSGGQLKVMVVTGPNQRKDFHIEEGEVQHRIHLL